MKEILGCELFLNNSHTVPCVVSFDNNFVLTVHVLGITMSVYDFRIVSTRSPKSYCSNLVNEINEFQKHPEDWNVLESCAYLYIPVNNVPEELYYRWDDAPVEKDWMHDVKIVAGGIAVAAAGAVVSSIVKKRRKKKAAAKANK